MLSRAQLQDQIKVLKGQVTSLQAELTTVKADLTSAQAELASSQAQVAQLAQDLADCQNPPPPPPDPGLYVAVDGNDANDGSSAKPWKTIQAALQKAQPGQTVIVKEGAYSSASFVRSGEAGAPITLKTSGVVTLTGDGSGEGLTVSGFSHIAIDGFEISNFAIGISIENASDVVVSGCTLRSNTGVGIQNWKVDHVTVVRNRFLDPGPPYPELADAIQDYGVNFYYSMNVVADDNYFFGKHNQALSFKRATSYGFARGNTFEGCMYTGIYVGQNDDDSYGDMTSQSLTVQNNRFRATTDPVTGSFYRVSVPITVRNVTSALVENNVIDPSCMLQTINVVASPQLTGLAAGNNTIRNNIVQSW